MILLQFDKYIITWAQSYCPIFKVLKGASGEAIIVELDVEAVDMKMEQFTSPVNTVANEHLGQKKDIKCLLDFASRRGKKADKW